MISTAILDSEEVDKDSSIDNYGAALDKYDASGSGEAYVSTGVTEAGKKDTK